MCQPVPPSDAANLESGAAITVGTPRTWIRFALCMCVWLVAACDSAEPDAGEADDVVECGPVAFCGEPRPAHPCGCGSPGQLSLMNGQTYACTDEGCLKAVPYPPGCFPVTNACGDFLGSWSLTYSGWQRRAGDDLDDAGAGDLAALKRCEEGNVDGWLSLKVTNGPDGICVDILGSLPDAVMQSGGCDPPPGGMLEVAKTTTWTSTSGSYRADSSLELELTWPGKASGLWKTVVTGSGECTFTANVDALLDK